MTGEDLAGWAVVLIALGAYAAAWLYCVAFVLGTLVTGWGRHDYLSLGEALVPLWCLLARDEAVMIRLEAILEARREEAGEPAPYEPRHAAPPEKRLADQDDVTWLLYMRNWPPYL